MNWQDAMKLSGTHTEYALSDLLDGHHVDFTAEDLQTLVNAVVKRCAKDTAPKTPRSGSCWWRRVLRTVIDIAALYCAWAIQFAASGSYAAAFITATAVGLYGLWCFYDGSA